MSMSHRGLMQPILARYLEGEGEGERGERREKDREWRGEGRKEEWRGK